MIVTYGSDLAVLDRELDSLLKQTHGDLRVQVVDNASANAAEVRALTESKGASFLAMPENRGIPKAINTAAKAASADYILALNNDIVLEPSAVAEMLAVAIVHPKCAAVAPKTYLSQFPGYFDSIGTLLNESYSAYNRGIGEPDIGQYDVSERTFGACFAAALLHRKIYLELGGLEEILFAYYEDVDWSYRANMRGYEIWTAPYATVIHHHSHAWQKEASQRKYYFIQRNLLRTALWNLRPRALARTLMARYEEHARRYAIDPDYRPVTRRILWHHLGDLAQAYPTRRRH
ncbi:MAG: glycosyltransferase family 2 protein, partial [Burkholderiales bacterium]